MVSISAGKKMNDCDAWGTLIESVGSVCADWVCLFASEVDAVLDSFETITVSGTG